MATEPRALVRNAADPQQVRTAKRLEKRIQDQRDGALRAVLQTVEGRTLLSNLLDSAGLFGSVYDHSGSMMYFKEGRRNFGLELRADIERVDEAMAERMDVERRARLRRDNSTIDAVHTASSDDQGDSNE